MRQKEHLHTNCFTTADYEFVAEARILLEMSKFGYIENITDRGQSEHGPVSRKEDVKGFGSFFYRFQHVNTFLNRERCKHLMSLNKIPVVVSCE